MAKLLTVSRANPRAATARRQPLRRVDLDAALIAALFAAELFVTALGVVRLELDAPVPAPTVVAAHVYAAH